MPGQRNVIVTALKATNGIGYGPTSYDTPNIPLYERQSITTYHLAKMLHGLLGYGLDIAR